MLHDAQATKTPAGKQAHDNPELPQRNGLKRKRGVQSFAEQSSCETPPREAAASDAHVGTGEPSLKLMGSTGSTHSFPADVTVRQTQQLHLLNAMDVSRLQRGDLVQLLKTPSSPSTSTTSDQSSEAGDKQSYLNAIPFVSPRLLFPKRGLASCIFPSTSPSTRRLSNAPNRSVTAPEEEKEGGKKDQLATY